MNDLWPISLAMAFTLALLQACALLALYVLMGRLLVRTDSRYKALITEDGPQLDAPIPPLSGTDIRTGEPVAATQFHGRQLALLFVGRNCPPCDVMLKALLARLRQRRDETAFMVLVQSDTAEAAAITRGLTGVPVVADADARIFHAFGVERTPLGVLVDALGHVRMKGVVNDGDQLAGLLAGRGRPIAGLKWSPADEGEPPVQRKSPEAALTGNGARGPAA